MIIAATILATDQADLVYDAARSVLPWADLVIVIAEHSYPATLAEVYRAAAQANKQGCVRFFRYEWDGDFANARNFALGCAQTCGADWAITLDADERINLNGLLIRDTLRESMVAEDGGIDTWMVNHDGATYAKDRIFRVPARGKWVGRVHECYTDFGTRVVLPFATFSEMPKSPEALAEKWERDAEALVQMTQEEPGNGRWWYYLGYTFQQIGHLGGAKDCYDKCFQVSSWREERAWAAYKMAEILHGEQEWGHTLTWAVQGLEVLPTAENAWMAALASYRDGEYRDAIVWAQFAVLLSAPLKPRTGFVYPPAFYEAPWNVLRFAHRALGDHQAADRAEEMYVLKLAERTNATVI